MRRPGHSELLSEISTAQPEGILSGLKRVKTYLRNSMSQARLNHIMILNVRRENPPKKIFPEITQEFVWESQYGKRKNDFGKLV